ncbi:isocitrate lyase/PEP mutase family protein [Ramlibacter albus]|uniref:Isocitrate lyase/phosphoenolpyruvate mutase family protein n=1 Tax=Ramlibacter albus TaxID=2079448 RepID=A0A923MA90_9BURK|nr:isocitrate lyase/phosphoenolpyruvate mutase family protein [Ramlibacter albus]MBC5766531.1 isocitrate lyase/phosphoenolpyruvate mutase family protein [Ramlibacter albus]
MSTPRPSVSDKRRTFHQLHQSGCFVIPNPWDIGSARFLQSLGFKALASTSAGFAWSQGHADNGVTRDMVVEHLAALVEATDVPVNADFESGFSADAAGVGESVRLAVQAGVAGLSIEDSTGNKDNPLYDIDTAVERLRAARKAIDATGGDTLLVGRAEGLLVGRPDMGDLVARLKAYANAGADCLYAPLLKTREQILTVVEAVAPKPVNLLMGWPGGMTVADISALGVRRISVGGALSSVAYSSFMNAARQLAEGRFDALTGAAGKELNPLFRGWGREA